MKLSLMNIYDLLLKGSLLATGDVHGGPPFTYISLDDVRIVYDYLFGNKEYILKERENVPYTHFLNPPLARVGLTEKQAEEKI